MNKWSLHRKAYWTQLRRGRRLIFLGTLLALFVTLAVATHSVRLLHLDERITEMFQHGHQPWQDRLAEGITFFGSTLFLIAVGMLAFWTLRRAARGKAAWFTLFSLLGLPLNWLLKQFVDRPRPAANSLIQVILPATGYSFPSGHTMASLMFYGFFIFLLWTEFPQSRRCRWAIVGLTLLIVSVGLSRIYLGVHWFSDVLAGWLAGSFFLLLLVEGYRLAVGDSTSSPESMPPAISYPPVT